MLDSQFINFSLNFELNKLLIANKRSSVDDLFSFKHLALTEPRLISNLGSAITFLILTDGSLFIFPYTLPCKGGSNKRFKSEICSYSISRSDYFSNFLKH